MEVHEYKLKNHFQSKENSFDAINMKKSTKTCKKKRLERRNHKNISKLHIKHYIIEMIITAPKQTVTCKCGLD